MSRSVLKSVWSLLLSGGEVYVVWLATANEVHGAGLLVRFMAWMTVFVSVLLKFGTECEASKPARPEIVLFIIRVAEVAEITILAWFGWYLCAVFYWTGLVTMANLHKKETAAAEVAKATTAGGQS